MNSDESSIGKCDSFCIVFMISGRLDPVALPENALQLGRIFKDAGADVSLHSSIGTGGYRNCQEMSS